LSRSIETLNPGDVVIFNAETPEQAVAEVAQPVAAFKRGRQTPGSRRSC
jgi:hypothetical protein